MHVGRPPQNACQPGVGAPTRAEWAEKWANWALNESIIRIIRRVGRPVRGLSHKLAPVCSPPCVMGDKGRVATSQRVSTCSSLPDVQKLAVFETIRT